MARALYVVACLVAPLLWGVGAVVIARKLTGRGRRSPPPDLEYYL